MFHIDHKYSYCVLGEEEEEEKKEEEEFEDEICPGESAMVPLSFSSQISFPGRDRGHGQSWAQKCGQVLYRDDPWK